ncbi:hypothetical protein [Flavobacterium sp. ACAM 123]|uniref:hypothetical protein n=1 Tax=Flavobacterium sp. ACAM 123 TaxID=1189620 RepID=UPI0003828DBA|nr:hypothetical protein [Flavobacterium sp. ACAM 123]
MLKSIIKNLSNLPGWRTNRKIVVIESDDWGSIRMSSKNAYDTLLSKGLILDKGAGARYNKYDTLASAEDLNCLFETLNSVKDKNNHSAKFTVVSLTSNPDFEKIKESKFETYFYEPITTTLEKYNKSDAFALWQEGIAANTFVPEFHGREHLNVQPWMRALKKGDREALLAFDYGIWCNDQKEGMGFQAAFDLEFATDLEEQKTIITDGLQLFEKLHGYKARFFVPPNGPINNELEKVAATAGIEFMSSPKIQKEVLGEGRTTTHFRYLGKNNKYGQTYITRNAFFEPSGSSKSEVASCLAEIELAFKFKKPAVISSHRVNYIGGLSVKNRDKGLIQLKELLKAITKKWPEVEFMTSTELGEIIRKKNRKNI